MVGRARVNRTCRSSISSLSEWRHAQSVRTRPKICRAKLLSLCFGGCGEFPSRHVACCRWKRRCSTRVGHSQCKCNRQRSLGFHGRSSRHMHVCRFTYKRKYSYWTKPRRPRCRGSFGPRRTRMPLFSCWCKSAILQRSLLETWFMSGCWCVVLRLYVCIGGLRISDL